MPDITMCNSVALKWTKERPTVPGWYFMRNNGIACVGAFEDDLFRESISDYVGGMHPHKANVEWAGPIPEPEEA